MKFSALKIALFLISFVLFFGFLTQAVSAETKALGEYPSPAQTETSQPQVNSNTAPTTDSSVPKNLHTYSQNVLIEVMAAVACQLGGMDPTNPQGKCLGYDMKTGKIGYVESNGGAIGFMGNMIAVLYTPPTHTITYIQHLAQNFGIVKSAHADPAAPNGTGFQGISPLLPLWSKFRDVTYILFVIIFVIVGVAIMLRLKIDPRTVMSIQNQIPKIIIGLLLVTFSFAIAGFLIDVMYTSIYLIGGTIESASPTLDKDNTTIKLAQAENPIDAANIIGGADGKPLGFVNISTPPAKGIGKFVASALDNTEGHILVGAISGLVGGYISNKATGGWLSKGLNLLSGPVAKWGSALICGAAAAPTTPAGQAAAAGTCATLVPKLVNFAIGTAAPAAASAAVGYFFADQVANGVVSIIAFIIITVALLWALIRLWFALITAYILLLLDIVFAPFWIVAGMFPGSSISFTSWLRNVVAQLAAFVAAIVMFELGKIFMELFGSSNATSQFVPPMITNASGTKAVGAIIGLGIILTTPTVVQMMKSMFGAPKLSFSGFGTAMGVGMGIGGIPMKLGQYGYYMGSIGQAPFVGGLFKRLSGGAKAKPSGPPQQH